MSRTSASCFVKGKTGEQYVRDHVQHLLVHGFIGEQKDTGKDNVEGGDSRITYYRFGEEVDMNDFSLDGMIDIKGTGHAIAKVETGGLEVKTIYNFTFRNNDNNEEHGTLPFELWNGERYGWLFALLYPELRLKPEDEQPIHSTQPVLFSFLLISYLGPYACVMFEDFPALAQRLKDYAEEQGFELVPKSNTHPNGVPLDDDTWRQDDPYIIDTCWHVPFDKLSDLATVTMIGGMPLNKSPIQLNQNDDYLNLQQKRYMYLLECADGRILPEEKESRESFYSSDETHLFADILNNMEIIDNLKQEDYPYLFKALKSLNMRKHFEMILYNMYSNLMITEINNIKMWFLQGTNYLHDWGTERRIRGSAFSWQSHGIFLTDADLLKKFVDNSNPLKPKLYRSVPKYTEEVLRAADLKAKAYIDAGIKLNNFQKPEVIKVSGQERADWLYLGDYRVVSAMQEEVDEVFIETANSLFEENRYLLPKEIQSKVESVIIQRYWCDPFEHTPEQWKKYRQACSECNRLKNRYEELSKDIQCDYRELTREEKTTLNLPLRSRTKYFIS